MDNAAYVALGRQAGLRNEMRIVANNLANVSTAGYRREASLFSEVIAALPVEGGSVSMSTARIRSTDFTAGDMEQTGGAFDLAIEGNGFFQLETPAGPRLTRAGAFLRRADGMLGTADGHAVMGAAGAPLLLPPDGAVIVVAPDGAVEVDGRPVGQVGVFAVEDLSTLRRETGQMFATEAPLIPAEGTLRQGFLEGGNVAPVVELARMIEVQRAYEAGQRLMETEDERARNAIRVLGAAA